MKRLHLLGLAMVLLASAGIVSNASAQEKTRAEVRQELIQAENNGLFFVTETSYPDVAPIFEQQVARLKQQNESDTGTETHGSSASGHRTEAGPVKSHVVTPSCTGPVDFCTPYFGG
jgi:Domain of unknown function (DUF4148)